MPRSFQPPAYTTDSARERLPSPRARDSRRAPFDERSDKTVALQRRKSPSLPDKSLRLPSDCVRLRALFAAIMFAQLSGCQPVPDPEIADPKTRVTDYLERLLSEDREVGLQYVVFDREKIVYEFYGGVLDAKTRARVDAATTFMLASTTKVFTSVAVMRLVQRGLLELDAPLSRYVPGQPYAEITVRQLLNHTAGVPNPLPLSWVHTRAEHEAYDEAATLATVLRDNTEPDAAPGERYAYSNLGYWLLGVVIAKATGGSYCAWLRQDVLQPLGLEDRDVDCDVADWSRHATGHLRRHSLMGWLMPWLTESHVWAEPADAWSRFQPLYMNGVAYGGLMGTARGVSRFGRDLLGTDGVLLDAESQGTLFSPQRDHTGGELPVALGWHKGSLDGHPYFSKPGGGPGFSSNLRLYQGSNWGTVFLSNQTRVSETEIEDVSNTLDAAFVSGSGAGR